VLGPVTAAALADALGIAEGDAEAALIALEAEGFVLRGQFTPGASERASGRASGREWCDRRLLARIHRYTLTRLRAEIEPVNAADFMRFLFRWQRVEPEARAAGLEGLAGVLEQLDGFELAAGAWEADVLPARVDGYGPELLDRLCLSGRVAWGRLSPPVRNGSGRQASAPLRSSPIAVFTRAHKDEWLALRAGSSSGEAGGGSDAAPRLSSYARAVQETLARRGASFFHELTGEAGLLPTQVEQALGELAAAGAVTSDSFAGLRALLTPASRRQPILSRRRRSLSPYGVETAGRWSLLRPAASERAGEAAGADPARAARDARERAVQAYAWALLRRYGVVFRKLVLREAGAPPWRELALCYRRLEARGEIRGGRFVAGFSGEQFALPDAVPQLRAARREKPAGRLLALSAADPLNLTGIVTPGERIAAVTRSRILFRDGVPIAAKEAGQLRLLTELNGERRDEIERALVRRNLPPLVRAYLSHAG
ncbi:MAG: ATP-dependent DNA helicase, partial [Gemmatimonadetes bacterium]|nr:ATP-dependent DNA helicase [Gemmatimonadota bacterium]